MEIPREDAPCLKLLSPYTMIVRGQTGCGKTYFVKRLLEEQDEMNEPAFQKVVYAYGAFQPLYLELKDTIPNLDLVEGCPNDFFNDLENGRANTNALLILDDLMLELENDKRLSKLFTKMRHSNLSTIFLVQNFYFNSRHNER